MTSRKSQLQTLQLVSNLGIKKLIKIIYTYRTLVKLPEQLKGRASRLVEKGVRCGVFLHGLTTIKLTQSPSMAQVTLKILYISRTLVY